MSRTCLENHFLSMFCLDLFHFFLGSCQSSIFCLDFGMSDFRYPMRLVAQRTGLSPHVLRAWERRYEAVTPERSETNRRLYSEAEIIRLELMARLTEAGNSIRQIAALSTTELETMAGALPSPTVTPSRSETSSPDQALLEEAWSCVVDLDSPALSKVLNRATVSLGISKFSADLIVPLIERIGTAWQSGEISAAEEHAASALIKEVLFTTSRPFAESTGAPNLVVATPAGQLHELGAVLVSCTARRDGWQVTYLGPSLPAAEIARAAIRNQSLAVGLSIVYPSDDPQLPAELLQLRQSLPDEVSILIGGRSAGYYNETAQEIGAKIVTDLAVLALELDKIRSRRSS
jgi:DNA-binding transcriptional MerR regulator/methylmalonyl-CoA mutase cobalamin-binding subunit